MDSGKCEPCKRMCKDAQGLYWCISCPELLCMACSKYHKALRATEWHSVVSIEKYESLLPILKTVQITCIQHQDKLFEYFCVTHDCPCCIQCKRSQHSACQDVEKIEEIVKAVDLSEELISLYSKIGNSLKILEKLSKNRDKNILKLRSQREDLYKQLKINRDLINKALNEFEADTKCVLENNLDKEKGVIVEQESEITSKIADLKHSQHQIESILNIKVESNIQFFLFQNKAKGQMKQNETDIDNMVASLLDISSACTLSTEIDHQSQFVKMLKTLEFQRRICSLDLELKNDSDEDNEITDSSTVEADDILKTSDLNLQLVDATPVTSVELLKDVTPQLQSVTLLKDVTPQPPTVNLLKDVIPQLPSVKLLKDVAPQPPSVKLLKDVTPQLPSAKLLTDVTHQLQGVNLYKDVTPLPPSVKLLKDVTAQLPSVKLLKDVTPHLPGVKLLKDVTPHLPGVNLLKDVTLQLSSVKSFEDVTPQPPNVKLLKDVTPQLPGVNLLKDVTPQLSRVKLLNDVTTKLPNVKLLKDVTPQLPGVNLLKDVTPQLSRVKLLKDVTPQLPGVKSFEDVTPQPPNVKLLKDVTPQLPGVNLLKDVTPQLSRVKLLNDVTTKLPNVKLLKDVTPQLPGVNLLKDVTPQLSRVKLLNDVTPQLPNVNLLKDVTPQLSSVKLLNDVTPQPPNVKLLKDVTPQLSTDKLLKDVTPQLPNVKLLKDVTSQLPSIKLLKDVTPQLPSAKGLLKEAARIKRETLFRYKNHFTFDTSEFMSESLNPFIKVVSNNRVLITGSPNKKLLFLTKSGKKQGEVTLDYPATSAAVIDDKTLAVAANVAVVFVDTETIKRIDMIPMGDKCVGIAYVKNHLVVNCITRGLIIMNRSGNVAQKLKSITGSMHICTLDDKTILLFNQLSNKIECLDISTSRKTSYIQVQGTHGPKCVTSDRNGNIFIAVKDEIFLTHPTSSSEYSTLLSKPYNIIRPLCIDIDIKSHELFVLNNDGKSVYCFQKQMDDA